MKRGITLFVIFDRILGDSRAGHFGGMFYGYLTMHV